MKESPYQSRRRFCTDRESSSTYLPLSKSYVASQRGMFESGYMPGSFDLDPLIRSLIAEVVKQSPKKREQIADEMGALLGRSITLKAFNAMTSPARADFRFPAAWLPAFCEVTGDYRLLEAIAEKLGLAIVGYQDLRLIQFAKTLLEKEGMERKLAELRKALSEETL